MPCPKKKLLVSAASAPTMNPQRRPSVAPAMMAMAETGFTSGTAANRMRPAVARAASTSVGMIWRSAGRLTSYPAKNSASTNSTTASMRTAAWAMPLASASAIAAGTAASSGTSSGRIARAIWPCACSPCIRPPMPIAPYGR